MTEVFLKIVNMSISAGWIVLAVLLLRILLKKAPKWITVLLWGIVAIRLICPFSIESVMSLIPSAQTVNPDVLISEAEINTGFEAVDNIVNPVISEAVTTIGPEKSVNMFKLSISLFSKLWFIGIAVMLIYALVSYFQVKRKVNTAVKLRDNIYQSESVVSPFVLGIIKANIYLPFNMSIQAEEHVIAHEEAHIKRKDHLWKPLGYIILTMHWFNPLIWLGYVLLCRDIELACDEKVVKKLTNEQRADYSQALLNCSVNRRLIAACPLAFGEVGIKARVKSVLNYKKPTFWIVIVAVISIIVTSVCLLTNPPKNVENVISKESEMLLSVLDNKAKFITGKGKEVYLKDYKPYYVSENQDYEKEDEFIPDKYTFVDMDSDGVEELIVSASPELYDYLILRTENNKIYGYSFEYNGLQNLKKDGSFRTFNGSYVSNFLTLSFKKEKYTETKFAEYKVWEDGVGGIKNESTINGKAVTYDEIKQFQTDWQNRPNAEWTYTNKSLLLVRIFGTNDANLIDNFVITHGYGDKSTAITDKNDLKFLEKYAYSHKYPSDKLHELFVFPQNQLVQLNSGNIINHSMYLMEDGSLVLQSRKTDNGNVVETLFDVYTADSKYMLDKSALIELLKKYGGIPIVGFDDSVSPIYSVNNNIFIKSENGEILLTADNFVNVYVQNNDNSSGVVITLTNAGKELFKTVTTENIGKKLNICIGEEVIASPTVNDTINRVKF